MPVRFIGPGSEALVDGEPSGRRSFIDWMLFHVEPGYLEVWRMANRVLAQRNAAIKQGQFGSAWGYWTEELREVSNCLSGLRLEGLSAMTSFMADYVTPFDFLADLEARFIPSAVPEGISELKALQESERKAGHSLIGFQRDDMRILIAGVPAKDALSRGEKKVLSYVLLMAEAILVHSKVGKIGALLVDDVCSELDEQNVDRLSGLVFESGLQTFVTALTRNYPDLIKTSKTDPQTFHVEHGVIRSTN